MITFKHYIFGVACLMAGLNACTDLDEKVYDRIDAGAYYQNEASVKGAVAAIYYQTSWQAKTSSICLNTRPTSLPGARGMGACGVGTKP